jgi:hypothetical protein
LDAPATVELRLPKVILRSGVLKILVTFPKH